MVESFAGKEAPYGDTPANDPLLGFIVTPSQERNKIFLDSIGTFYIANSNGSNNRTLRC